MTGFLEYSAGASALHRMNPLVKLFGATALALACFLASGLPLLLALLALGLALAASCGLLARALRVGLAVLAFSAVLATLQVLTTPEGAALLPLPFGYVGTVGVQRACATMVRLVAAAIPFYLAFTVTKLTDITDAAVKVLRVPYRYAFTFASAVRFVPLFLNDMSAVMEAQMARGVSFDDVGPVRKVGMMAPLCVPLLVSSVRKINSSAIAAELRGFNLRTRASGYRSYPLGALDGVALATCAALLVAGALL
ncbi:energy-coupling factor transporter transmembrane protein EcfT [Eggerthellaceae bacterium zg-1084]|uniref:energy-coupling factor transporter transmembrane component T family protein n=1 Tax=Berryella wangjianweii TaxID=2734634 RepID=UPI001556D421|nr:energy-coupling factor transporter transmembrane protein EcfT [Berryella wangjianweii]NPD30820.1 energy-coupling factor transporter transmembrane protein EcfT [Berryella wangjianweii]